MYFHCSVKAYCDDIIPYCTTHTLYTIDSYTFHELWLVLGFCLRFHDDLPLLLITLISASTVAGAVAVAVTVTITANGSIEKREREKMFFLLGCYMTTIKIKFRNGQDIN